MTRSCWNILRVNLARRNQRPEGGEVSEIIQAHGSATGGAWLCSSIRPFLHSNFYRLFGTRRNGVDQAWSNGMEVILLTVGVFTCWMCITRDGGAWWSLEGVLWGIFFQSLPTFPLPYLHGDRRSRAWSCTLSFCSTYLFVSLCFGVGGLDFPEYTMLIFLVRLPPDSNIAFCP